jgi:hypothetical protein
LTALLYLANQLNILTGKICLKAVRFHAHGGPKGLVMMPLSNLKSPCPTDAIILEEGKQVGKVILRIDE